MTEGILYLSWADVAQCLSMPDTINAVEHALRQLGNGAASQSSKISLTIQPLQGSLKAMSAFIHNTTPIVATKNYALIPSNRRKGLPTVPALIVLHDPTTLLPIAILDGTLITMWRTAATSAIAAKYLANPSAAVVGIIGAGAQGRSHLLALNEVFDLTCVKIMDVNATYRDTYADEMQRTLGVEVRPVKTYRAAVMDTDIVVTATTGCGAFVQRPWLRTGMTILKVGSYQELDLDVLTAIDKLVVDSWQYTHTTVPEIRDAGIQRDQIYAEIAEIVAKRKPGREQDDEQIVFISIGMGVEDAGPAFHAYQRAQSLGIGRRLDR